MTQLQGIALQKVTAFLGNWSLFELNTARRQVRDELAFNSYVNVDPTKVEIRFEPVFYKYLFQQMTDDYSLPFDDEGIMHWINNQCAQSDCSLELHVESWPMRYKFDGDYHNVSSPFEKFEVTFAKIDYNVIRTKHHYVMRFSNVDEFIRVNPDWIIEELEEQIGDAIESGEIVRITPK